MTLNPPETAEGTIRWTIAYDRIVRPVHVVKANGEGSQLHWLLVHGGKASLLRKFSEHVMVNFDLKDGVQKAKHVECRHMHKIAQATKQTVGQAHIL